MLMRKVLLMGVLVLPTLTNAQTCKPDSIPATTPTNQFNDHGNGTVTDTKTGLMWKKCSEGQIWDSNTNSCSGGNIVYTWQKALQQAQKVNTDGGFASYIDWRVPNKNELASLVEEQCYAPAINLAVFPNASSNSYWSSSPLSDDGDGAWSISFGYGSENSVSKNLNGYWYDVIYYGSIRLVRGGQ